jgi:hypothetical protein
VQAFAASMIVIANHSRASLFRNERGRERGVIRGQRLQPLLDERPRARASGVNIFGRAGFAADAAARTNATANRARRIHVKHIVGTPRTAYFVTGSFAWPSTAGATGTSFATATKSSWMGLMHSALVSS